MAPVTATHQITDRRMWRLLLARVHPDAGGMEEMFVWVQSVMESVCKALAAPSSASSEPYPPSDLGYAGSDARVPFDPNCTPGHFDRLTDKALATAREVGEPYASLLEMLADLHEEYSWGAVRQQNMGATYKQLGLIGYRWGMTGPERTRWYRLAESLSLSQHHANHILQRLHEKPERAA